jgi:hypothetical protein
MRSRVGVVCSSVGPRYVMELGLDLPLMLYPAPLMNSYRNRKGAPRDLTFV